MLSFSAFIGHQAVLRCAHFLCLFDRDMLTDIRLFLIAHMLTSDL